MYEKVSERSEVLDDRIEEMAQLVKDHYDIPDFGDPSATTEVRIRRHSVSQIFSEMQPRRTFLSLDV